MFIPKHLPILLSIFILISCNEIKKLPSYLPFSISLGTFKNYEEASKYRLNFPNDIRAKIRYELVTTKKYKLLYGYYESSYKAGEKAFELFLQNKIRNYEIVKDGQSILDEFINIPYIENYLGRLSLFNYNLRTKEKEINLTINRKDITIINMNKNCDKIFLTTTDLLGNVKNSSFIKDVELFLYERNTEKLISLMNYGNVKYYYSFWDNTDTFKVSIVQYESNPRFVKYTLYTWDTNGNGKLSKEKRYDLLTEGFPKIPKRIPEYYSPNYNYQIKVVNEQGVNNLYIKDYVKKSELLLGLTDKKIYDMRWSNDSKYIFVLTRNESLSQESEELMIIDVNKKMITKKINSKKFNHILVRGKFLFYDTLTDKSSSINVLNLDNLVEYDNINGIGGTYLISIY